MLKANVFIAIIGAVCGVATSFITASATSDAKVNTVDTQVQVLQERQSLQYAELKAGIDRIEAKIDRSLRTPDAK